MAVPESEAEERRATTPVWNLALCWKDEAIPVNLPPDSRSLARRFETLCRRQGVLCLVDLLPLPPARGVRSLLKPVPRMQALVSSLWPDAAALRILEESVPEAEGAAQTPLLGALAQRDLAAFYVPGLAIPTLVQAEQRLARIQVMGPNAMLGTLRQLPADPPALPEQLDHPHIAEIREHEARIQRDPRYAALQYDRRCFSALTNTSNGDVRPGLRFDYHEEGGAIWAWYEGDGVFLGVLAANRSQTGALRLAYQHLNAADEIRAGQCLSFPEFLPDGRLRMHEFWRWTSGDRSAGISQIEECEGTTIPRKYA